MKEEAKIIGNPFCNKCRSYHTITGPCTLKDESAIIRRLSNIIQNHYNLNDLVITRDTDPLADFGGDSLDAVELIMAVEEEFGVAIDDGDVESMKTVGDMIDYLSKNTELDNEDNNLTRYQRDVLKSARANHMWLNAVSCINPTDKLKVEIGEWVLTMLSRRDCLIQADYDDCEILRDMEQPELILRFNRS